MMHTERVLVIRTYPYSFAVRTAKSVPALADRADADAKGQAEALHGIGAEPLSPVQRADTLGISGPPRRQGNEQRQLMPGQRSGEAAQSCFGKLLDCFIDLPLGLPERLPAALPVPGKDRTIA